MRQIAVLVAVLAAGLAAHRHPQGKSVPDGIGERLGVCAASAPSQSPQLAPKEEVHALRAEREGVLVLPIRLEGEGTGGIFSRSTPTPEFRCDR
jgi:hypothetical protein